MPYSPEAVHLATQDSIASLYRNPHAIILILFSYNINIILDTTDQVLQESVESLSMYRIHWMKVITELQPCKVAI